ncbi:MAG: DUF3857 domain-containing transglutaminase family protein [Verrucomicrobiota bacterium]|jgi:hypothetical protein
MEMLNEGNAVWSDAISLAKSRVQSGPPPDWVVPCPYDLAFKGEQDTQITVLLFDQQIHAEQRSLFVHQVLRLETMQAVQHWSQWRLQFEPKTQLIALHTLKIRRGNVEIDQSNLEKSHLLQREEGLERFIISGWFTLLMVLEDVRPGDVLDFSYTMRNESALFPNHGGHFFTPPQGVPVGKYHLAVQFNNARQRKWKSSSPALTPVEKKENERTFWEWSGEKYCSAKPESNCPSWHLSNLWIQVSDFPDWQMVAAGLAQAWAAEADGEAVAEIARDIRSKAGDLPSQIQKAIELVQDDCRYLSVSLEVGGNIPTSPGVVARRRFGDCKDLSFLLAKLLREFGVTARPVLVNVFLRKSVLDFLPSPSLFNHAVVEFEAEGKRRWIDATLKEQGGSAFSRTIPDYGVGLPVDAAATGLVQPPQFEPPDLFVLREHVLLDTSNAPSLMAVTLITEGVQAELLRRQLKQLGMEEWAKQRLQVMVNRFRNVKRVGEIKCRDERGANRFTLVEVFEINFFLAKHPNPKLCRFNLPGNWLAGVLLMPQKAERRTPFLLPYPCHIQYTADVDSPAIQRIRLNEPREGLQSPFVQFSRNTKGGHGYLVMKLSLTTSADAVPADQVQKHGEMIEQICRGACRELSLLRGYDRSRPKAGFDELPAENNEIKPPPLPWTPIHREMAAPERHRHRHREPGRVLEELRRIPWRWIWIFFVILGVILTALLR